MGGVLHSYVREIAVGGDVEDDVELADELGDGEAACPAEGFEVEGFVVTGVQHVAGDAEPFENFLFCGRFKGGDGFYLAMVGVMGLDEMAEQEDEVFIFGVRSVGLGFEVGDEGGELPLESGDDRG